MFQTVLIVITKFKLQTDKPCNRIVRAIKQDFQLYIVFLKSNKRLAEKNEDFPKSFVLILEFNFKPHKLTIIN